MNKGLRWMSLGGYPLRRVRRFLGRKGPGDVGGSELVAAIWAIRPSLKSDAAQRVPTNDDVTQPARPYQ